MKKYISVFLSICIVLGMSQLNVLAINNKIDAKLLAFMEDKSDTDLIPVWLWLKEIDEQEIDDALLSKKNINASNYASEAAFNAKVVPHIADSIDSVFAINKSKIFNSPQCFDVACSNTEQDGENGIYINRQINNNIEKYINARREIIKEEYFEYNVSFINKYLKGKEEKIIYNSDYTSILIVQATKKEIEKYAQDARVEKISLYTQIRLKPDYSRTIEHVYAGYNNEGTSLTYKGVGVNVGIIEADKGVYEEDAPQLQRDENDVGQLNQVNAAGVDGAPISGTRSHPHATAVTSIIAGKQATYQRGNVTYEGGVVPCANIYQIPVGNDFMEETLRAFEILADKGVSIINFSASNEKSSNEYDEFDKAIDRLIASTNITFVNTPGNGYSDNTQSDIVHSPGKALNAITVANAATNKVSDPTKLRPEFSDIIELSAPYSINSNASYTADNYLPNKPDIAAPGTYISWMRDDREQKTSFIVDSGTSFAAPIVTGIVAQMMQANPWLKTNPVAVKSKLLLAADYNKISNVDNLVATDSTYLKDKSGAGLIDAIAAVHVSKSNNDIEMFINSLKEQKSKNYYFKAGQKIRAVMVYSKENINLIKSKDNMDIVDFYLRKADGTSVASSISDRNNVRIIEYQFDEDGFYYFSANPRQLTNNEGETDYAGVKAHISFQFSNLTANITDLEYDGIYYFTLIKFIDDMLEYRNKQIYVVINKHDANSTVTEIANVTININNSGIGLYNSNGIEFGEDEFIEILMYEDKEHQNQIAMELVN